METGIAKIFNGSTPFVKAVVTLLAGLLLFSMQYQFSRINVRIDQLCVKVDSLVTSYAELGGPKDPLYGEVQRMRDTIREHDKQLVILSERGRSAPR